MPLRPPKLARSLGAARRPSCYPSPVGPYTERPKSTLRHAVVLRPSTSSAAWALALITRHDRLAAKSRRVPSDHRSDVLIVASAAPGVARSPDPKRLLARSATCSPRKVPSRPLENNVQTKTYGPNRLSSHRCFYFAVARSAVSSSPIPRNPSLNCDQPKTRPSITRAGSAMFVAVDMPGLW